MEKLVISLDEVKNIAGELKNLNTQISTKLEDCKKEMNSLNGVWESGARGRSKNALSISLSVF